MRDILVALIVFGSLPFIMRKPYIGVLMWVWISVMNPHMLGWGFGSSFPFAAIIGATTLLSLILTREPKALPSTSVTWAFLAFVFWINVSALFALHPELASEQWIKVTKIMLMVVVPLLLLKTKDHVQLLIWVMVISLGFYGVKGGIFTITGGGNNRVWGPPTTFIDGNNEIALALIMTIPLMHYLQTISLNKWVRHILTVSMLLCAIAALGTYSRGALLAIAAMGLFLWLKSQRKLPLGLLMLLAVPFIIAFMPEKWGARMDTISEYKQDQSAMGRINTWQMAFNLAKDRPLVGGGFEIYNLHTFSRYAPVPTDVHAAHSIYFQALGELGFVGLGLYLLLGFLTWRTGSWIIRNTKGRDDLKWAFNLATMIQVSIIGFAVGGAFLSLLYFDVPYYLMVAIAVTRVVVEKELKAESALGSRNQSGRGSRLVNPSAPPSTI
jgi:probable O-glycosylation ligase (exosortase A-associated)